MLIPNIVSINGSTVVWKRQYQITNNLASTYVLSLSEPVGVVFSTNLSGPNTVYAPGQITFNNIGPGTNIITIILEYTVPNAQLGPFTFTVDRLSGPDTNLTNNLGTDILNSEFCPPAGGAVDDPFGCICGTVATNDNQCSSCTTNYIEDGGFRVNITTFNLDLLTGDYQIVKTDPTLPSTFRYHMRCVNCADGNSYDVGVSALVTIAPLFSSFPVNHLIKEDFENLVIGTNTVALANVPLFGIPEIFVYRNGLEALQSEWTLFGNTITFFLPFGPSGGASGLESVTVHYWIP